MERSKWWSGDEKEVSRSWTRLHRGSLLLSNRIRQNGTVASLGFDQGEVLGWRSLCHSLWMLNSIFKRKKMKRWR
jgi:hypothetical protein